jgi:hypothetical protein
MLTLMIALASLAAWAVLVFVVPVTSGVVHLLLAVGATLLVRWWALRDSPSTR